MNHATLIRQLHDGRSVLLFPDGHMEFVDAGGSLLQAIEPGDSMYQGLGLQLLERKPATEATTEQEAQPASGGVLVDADPSEPASFPTVWHDPGDGGPKVLVIESRHGHVLNAMDPSSVSDPYALVWIGTENVRAYGTVGQSNEIRYGSREPTAEQINAGNSI